MHHLNSLKNITKFTNIMLQIRLVIWVILAFFALASGADKKPNLPRFASIKASEANTRAGPGMNYHLLFLYQYRGIPVEIIAEYDQWRKIRDINGDEGWIHSSILSGKRYVMIKTQEEIFLHSKDSAKSEILARLSKYYTCQLLKHLNSWCKVKCAEYTGWVERKYIWGLYDYE
ncbi:MAG: SH3 domain-containing protein [Rickettsiaceae bacterium]|nr:SH3 domain-containing protein [Rickettsiaceae bacterium]